MGCSRSQPVVSVVFSEDGKTLYRNVYINELKLWNLFTGELIKNLKNHSANVTSRVLSTVNGDIEYADMTGTGEPFEMFDLGHETRTLKGYSTGIFTQAHSPDGRFTARSNNDSEFLVELLDRQTEQIIYILKGHRAEIQSLAFSRDSKLLASTSAGDLIIWMVETGKQIDDTDYSNSLYGISLTFTQTEFTKQPTLVTSHFCGAFRHKCSVLDRNGKLTYGTGGSSGSAFVFYSANGKVIARSYDSPLVQLWNLETGEEFGTFHCDDEDGVALALSPTGNILLAVLNEEINLLNIKTNTVLHNLKFNWQFNITAIAFSPDERMLAISFVNGAVKLWNLQTGSERQACRRYIRIDALAFSPVENILASGSADGTIKLWDLETMEEVYSFQSHQKEIDLLKFSPDGKYLASGYEGCINLWNLKRL